MISEIQSKSCTQCKQVKTVDMFYWVKRDKGYSAACRACFNERARLYKAKVKSMADELPMDIQKLINNEESRVKQMRSHLDIQSYLNEIDLNDKPHLKEWELPFRSYLRSQEPWFLEIAAKYR